MHFRCPLRLALVPWDATALCITAWRKGWINWLLLAPTIINALEFSMLKHLNYNCKELYIYVFYVFIQRLKNTTTGRVSWDDLLFSLSVNYLEATADSSFSLPVPMVSCCNEPLFIQTSVNCSLATVTEVPPRGRRTRNKTGICFFMTHIMKNASYGTVW
jgi:hypothetical protein